MTIINTYAKTDYKFDWIVKTNVKAPQRQTFARNLLHHNFAWMCYELIQAAELDSKLNKLKLENAAW